MTRQAYDESKKLQAAILPGKTGLRITQGPNPAKDGTIVPATPNVYWTHNGYHAIDHSDDEGNLYAPFDMECVKIDNFGGSVYFSFFRSLNKVICADGDISFVSFLCIHGGNDIDIEGEDSNGNFISKLQVGAIIRQGKKFYQKGSEGLSSGPHIHIDAMKGRFNDTFSYSTYIKNYEQKDYYGVNQINAGGLINGEYLENIFYKLPTDKILFGSYGSNWQGHINFKTFVAIPFNPTGKANGWYEYNGDKYYVKNESVVIGWQQLPITNGSTTLDDFYFNTSGVMQKNSWIAGANDTWYYVGPNGRMIKNDWINDPVNSSTWYHVDTEGKMQTGWYLDTNNAYYFLNDGRFTDSPKGLMMRSRWVASTSTDWYYVKESGCMACDESLVIDGKTYNFAANGLCLNPQGN